MQRIRFRESGLVLRIWSLNYHTYHPQVMLMHGHGRESLLSFLKDNTPHPLEKAIPLPATQQPGNGHVT